MIKNLLKWLRVGFPKPTSMMSGTVSREDMERANRLVCWMAGYIGKMAPIHYGDCYAELNEHFMAMERLGVSTDDPSKSKGAV